MMATKRREDANLLQSDADVEPSADVVLSVAQVVQEADPRAALYDPTEQMVQVLPLIL